MKPGKCWYCSKQGDVTCAMTPAASDLTISPTDILASIDDRQAIPLSCQKSSVNKLNINRLQIPQLHTKITLIQIFLLESRYLRRFLKLFSSLVTY